MSDIVLPERLSKNDKNIIAELLIRQQKTEAILSNMVYVDVPKFKSNDPEVNEITERLQELNKKRRLSSSDVKIGVYLLNRWKLLTNYKEPEL